MITKSNNNAHDVSRDEEFFNDELDGKKSNDKAEEQASEDQEQKNDEEDLENPEEKPLQEKAEGLQKPKNIDEADDDNKAALTAGTSIDEDIKANAEESPAVENAEAEKELEKPEHSSGQDITMEEIVSVEELDDIGQTEEEYAKNEEETEEEYSKGEEDEEEKDEEENEDYSSFSKTQLVHAAEELLKEENVRKADNVLKEIKSFYDEIYAAEKKAALEKFIDEGGNETEFDYAGDELDAKFDSVYKTIKSKKEKYLAEMEKNREQNLAAKNQVLEKLRKLVDAEENTSSITALKEIQNEWRAIGPVPSQYVRSLWANYSALIDRFYDKRSIYFELKELDRKKNLEAKVDICERAERLVNEPNLKKAIKELNDLHEEFKHVGPTPRDEQEAIWKRFKAASDKVYARRKEFVESLKTNLKQNFEEKQKLSEQVQAFVEFDSDKISDWNAKTKEILDIQKKWESIGSLPREHAKDINKQFWSSFKKFFNNKSAFFKKLEGQREENLKLKEELVRRAESLRDSDDMEKTANELKELQKEWKDIGPVPERVRNDVYLRFKKACDDFFERKRSSEKETEKDYILNLKLKEEICSQIEKLAEENSNDVEKVESLMDEYNDIGFVPRNSIKSIQKRFLKAVEKFANNAQELSAEEKKDVLIAAQYQKLRNSPNASRRLQRKENSIKRQISELENDISLWKNNIEFFASSESADKLKAEFNEKIARARKELKDLKQQLKVIRTI